MLLGGHHKKTLMSGNDAAWDVGQSITVIFNVVRNKKEAGLAVLISGGFVNPVPLNAA